MTSVGRYQDPRVAARVRELPAWRAEADARLLRVCRELGEEMRLEAARRREEAAAESDAG